MANDSLIRYYVILTSPETRSDGSRFIGVRSRNHCGRLGTIRQVSARSGNLLPFIKGYSVCVHASTSHYAVVSFSSSPLGGQGLGGGLRSSDAVCRSPEVRAPHPNPPRTRREGILKRSAPLIHLQFNVIGTCCGRRRLGACGSRLEPVRGFGIPVPFRSRTACSARFLRLPADFLNQFPRLLRSLRHHPAGEPGTNPLS